jgi:hypothetical protein
MRRAVTILCIALTIALAVVGLRMWQAQERKEAHIDWLMKKYRWVSYNCLAYDECTDAERTYIADCGKPTALYSTPNPQADAVANSITLRLLDSCRRQPDKLLSLAAEELARSIITEQGLMPKGQ